MMFKVFVVLAGLLSYSALTHDSEEIGHEIEVMRYESGDSPVGREDLGVKRTLLLDRTKDCHDFSKR